MIKILLVVAILCSSALSLHMAAPPKRYYINTDVENYISGSQTGQTNYLKLITQPANAVKCPFHKPFTTDGTICFQCSIQTPIFNFETLRCEICPTGLKGFANHKCQ